MNGEKQAEQERQALERFIADEGCWPWFPILPVKRQQAGLLTDKRQGGRE